MQGYIKNALRSGKHLSDSASNNNAILVISNDEMKNIIEIVKYLQYSGLLFKWVSETIQNETAKQKGGFLSMLLGTLGVSFVRTYFNR